MIFTHTHTHTHTQASTSEQSLHQSTSSLPPVGYGTNSNTATHNHHYQEQNAQMGNSHNSSSNLRNSMVAHHQSHQGYAPNGSVLVNGGSNAASSRQLQGGQSSSSVAGSGPSQSGQSSQVPVMNHQSQREDNFDVSLFSLSLPPPLLPLSLPHPPLSLLPSLPLFCLLFSSSFL